MASIPYTAADITLRETCPACPEQYNAYVIGDQQVGYLRLRHGFFRVDFPNAFGRTVYEAEPRGDGCFEDDEREAYLTTAKAAIAETLNALLVTGTATDPAETLRAAAQTAHDLLAAPADAGGPVAEAFQVPADATRGAEFYDLIMALRHDRAAATRLKVWRIINRLAARHRAQDRAERDGRPSWRNPSEILARHVSLQAEVLRTGRRA